MEYKVKLFFNLAYIKYNDNGWCFRFFGLPILSKRCVDFWTTEWFIKFLGFKILKSKVKDVFTCKERVYFLGIKIFENDIFERLRKICLNTIINRFPAYDSYYIFTSGCGENTLLFSHLEEIIAKDAYKNPLIIVDKQYLLDCYNLFPNLKFPCVVLPDARCIFLDKYMQYKGKNFIVPCNFAYYGHNELNIINKNLHYYEALKQHLGIENAPIFPVYTEYNDKTMKNLAQYVLNNKFVVIFPEAVTIENLPCEFWDLLSSKFKEQGYQVFYNSMHTKIYKQGEISINFKIQDLIELCRYCSGIIGIRSGFLEVVSSFSKAPSFVIYNKFNSNAQNILTSNQVITGFTMYKLPYRTKDLYEYNYQNQDYTELAKKILGDFLKNAQNI